MEINKNTYAQRFREAVALLVGSVPPCSLVDDWINNVDRDDDLQQWVGNSGGPWWAQNIAILDAAETLADQPIEGPVKEICYRSTRDSLSDLEIVQKALKTVGNYGGTLVLQDDGSCLIYEYPNMDDPHALGFAEHQDLLAWAKQTIGIEL